LSFHDIADAFLQLAASNIELSIYTNQHIKGVIVRLDELSQDLHAQKAVALDEIRYARIDPILLTINELATEITRHMICINDNTKNGVQS
jgi:hypothetical protein